MSRRVIIAFYDPDEPRWAWLLKPGFRHVIAAIDDDANWVLVDALDGRPLVMRICENTFDLASWWREQGYTVIETVQGEALRSPVVAANCVGLVMAACCINTFALTPFQLYKHLARGDVRKTEDEHAAPRLQQKSPVPAGIARSRHDQNRREGAAQGRS